MTDAYAKVVADLRASFGHFPLACLLHLKVNRHRLLRRRFTDGDKGCLFFLLSETLPADCRIDSRERLTQYFTGGSGEGFRELEIYQPPRWITRLFDGDCVERYDGLNELPLDLIFTCLDEVITERQAREVEAARVERVAAKRQRQPRARQTVTP